MGQPFGHQLIIGRIDHPHAGEASRLENRCGDNRRLLSKPYSSQFTSWPRKTLMPAPLMQLLPLCRSIESRNPSPQKDFQKAVLVTKCSLVAVYFGVSATICFKLSRNSKKHRMFLSRVILRSWAFVLHAQAAFVSQTEFWRIVWQTGIRVGDWLYIDGGGAYFASNPALAVILNQTISIDLSKSWTTSSVLKSLRTIRKSGGPVYGCIRYQMTFTPLVESLFK